jgi:hypothetical protein
VALEGKGPLTSKAYREKNSLGAFLEHSLVALSRGYLLLTMTCHFSAYRHVQQRVQMMSGNNAAAKTNVTEPSTPTGAVAPTGYRVSLVPGALEVSARLANADELRNLVKVLRASVVILDDATEDEADTPLSLTKHFTEANTRK